MKDDDSLEVVRLKRTIMFRGLPLTNRRSLHGFEPKTFEIASEKHSCRDDAITYP